MTRDEIFLLLEKNQISMRPDDGAAIDAIEKYINGDAAELPDADEELAKLDSSIDNAADAAEEVYRDASATAKEAERTLRGLLDDWNSHAVLRDFAFAFSAEERRYVVNSFSDACQRLRGIMSEMSALSGRAGEAASMLRGCAADASLLAAELRYAAIAARILGNFTLESERQTLSDERRSRAAAAEKLAAEILRVIRALSTSMSSVSAAIPVAASALHIDDEGGASADASRMISPQRAAAALSNAVSAISAAGFDRR